MRTFLRPILFLLLTCAGLQAQTPFGFNYQAVARDADGSPFAERQISMLISIVSSFEEGPLEFQEVHEVITNAQGMFRIVIGDGEFLFGNLRIIEWGTDTYFIRAELDPEGGDNYADFGTERLYAVPYALYAETAGNASGTENTDDQQLNLDGTTLSIEDGNAVDLRILQDGVTDNDADPQNELQMLSLNGSTLSVSSGNSVTLPTGSGSSFWEELNTGSIFYRGSRIFLEDPTGDLLLDFGESQEGGYVQTFRNGSITSTLGTTFSGNGQLELNRSDGSSLIQLSGNTGNNGFLELLDPSEQPLIQLTSSGGDLTSGYIGIFTENNDLTLIQSTLTSGGGFLSSRGPNGNANVNISTLSNFPNNGFLSVKDEDGTTQAGVYVDADGMGIVFGDVSSFSMPHPVAKNSQIVYAAIEGPEAAAYLRGTSRLENGEVRIAFPDHFRHIVNPETMTVMITPLSAESKGMAVIEKTATGFRVKELADGNGSYAFDWEVKGVRKGYESFRPIRPRDSQQTDIPSPLKRQNNEDK